MDVLFTLLCFAAPPLLMWWMLRVQRRVRAQARLKREEEPRMPAETAYVEAERGADGLSYGRTSGGEALRPEGLTPELDGIQALQGRR
jgi:hypothetical protein